jgi:hypothetical protein
MDNQLYLQKLRRDYIQMGEQYIVFVKDHRSSSEIRYISNSIRSLLTEIRAIEQELRRKTA